MRSINGSATLKAVFSLCFLIALALIKNSDAGEYFIYQDPNGQLTLSNSAPPPGSKIIKRETLPEATNEQIAEARVREDKVALDNRLADLEKTVGELSDHLRAQNEIMLGLQQGYSENNTAVGVTQAPAILTRPRRGHLPPRVRPDLPTTQPHGTIPSPGQQRSGGRTG